MSVGALKMSPSVKPKLDSVFALNSPGVLDKWYHLPYAGFAKVFAYSPTKPK